MAKRRKKKKIMTQARHLIAKCNPRSPIAEQYRTIRTNLQFSSVDQELQTILITSSGPGEGKSMIIANLATVYAQAGKKVLLVDADLRKPTAHYTFCLDNIKGLSNLLVSDLAINEVVNSSNVENLDIISSGPIPPNPSELLGSKLMQKFIGSACEYYDIILFDTPPILAVTDAHLLANFVDGSILVVRSNVVEYEAAIKAKKSLENSTAKLLGTILNDRERKKKNTYYYYDNH